MIRTLLKLVFASGLLFSTNAHAADVRLPEYREYTLANGAQVMLMPRRDVPLVSAAVAVRGGGLADAPGKEGSANLLADLLSKGAGQRDALAFAQTVDGAGGSLGFSASGEAIIGRAQFLAKDSGLMLTLLADALLAPKLEQAEFDKLRQRSIDGIITAKDGDPSGLLGSYADAWQFRDHPYGRPLAGDETSLARITLADLQTYRRQQMGADRLTIVIAGDFDEAKTRADIQRLFGGWGKAEGRLPELAATAPEQGRRVLLVDKPGATQTYFSLGNIGGVYGDPHEAAQDLVQTVFGGRFTSMLNTELRVKSGLTYGARASIARTRVAGPVRITSFTKTETTAQAIDLAIATLDRMHGEAFDADTLASARNYVTGQFAPGLETAPQLAGKLLELALFEQNRDKVDGYLGRIAAASASDIAAARSVFPQSSDLVIVAIGDASKIRDTMKKYGPLTEMKMSDPSFAPGK